MRLSRPIVGAVAAAAAAFSLTAFAGSATADSRDDGDRGVSSRNSFVVIGDLPYGAAQIAALPGWVDDINAADPRFTIHVGDIKNGSSRCDDAYYAMIRTQFDRFAGPLVYTPGDNEWTDCHRVNNGSYNPLERLAHDRAVFFADPGRTLGQKPMRVRSQVRAGFPENVTFSRSDIEFAVIHVVGSNNDLQPWLGLGPAYAVATPEQVAEQSARMANALSVLRSTFARAREEGGGAVVVALQADMFDPTYTPPWSDISAFQPLVQALVDEASRYSGQVYLFNGDSHVYNADHPLAAGSPWLTRYAVQGHADNLTRVTVDGSSQNKDFLRVSIHEDDADARLTWERVPYTVH